MLLLQSFCMQALELKEIDLIHCMLPLIEKTKGKGLRSLSLAIEKVGVIDEDIEGEFHEPLWINKYGLSNKNLGKTLN